MGCESKVEYLIVDTSAFIKNAPLQDYGNHIITEPNVVSEITSKRQLKRLVVLPYDLKVKDADPEDIQFVTEFAKKTGDYTSLSLTDIKVIALTYRYEIEKVGKSHLREEPEIKKKLIDSSIVQTNGQVKNLVGFYMPDENEEDEEDENDGVEEKKKEEIEIINNGKNEKALNEEQNSVNQSEVDNKDEEFIISRNDEKETYGVEITEKIEESDEYTSDEYEDCNEADDNDDIENGWITPANVKSVKVRVGAGVIKEKAATVACLTMDFAMQNVLMQIGLNVASLEGKIIKEMRTFILRCYACFKTTSIMTKIFCPSCGNKTLKKVAVSLDDEGKQKIHINFRKPLTSRGKKFSLPTFQGGKHACNPILFEDQRIPDQRPSKLGCAKNDPLKDDYIAGYSPFVTRDVNSRAARLGIKSNMTPKHWMKKNPNEARRKKK